MGEERFQTLNLLISFHDQLIEACETMVDSSSDVAAVVIGAPFELLQSRVQRSLGRKKKVSSHGQSILFLTWLLLSKSPKQGISQRNHRQRGEHPWPQFHCVDSDVQAQTNSPCFAATLLMMMVMVVIMRVVV